MKFSEVINSVFRRGSRVLNGNTGSFIGGWSGSCYPFADAVFLNICELLTDLCRDVSWSFDGSNPALEASFIRFFNTYGQVVLNKMYRDGIVVIGHTQQGEGAAAAHEFHLCTANEYRTSTHNEWVDVVPMVPGLDVYALRSATFQTTGRSDKAVLQPFLSFLDNTLNASNTISERMGAFVVASPKNLTSSPVPSILNEKDKAALESQISEEYGALHKQKQVMVLPREMSWQVISLAQLDLKTQDKAKMAVLSIADRIKVPANQIGFIDANSSKSLANGTELREGDFNKYQSFERLLDGTFVQMARDCGLRPGMSEVVQGQLQKTYYTIYNKPKKQDGEDITNLNSELLGVLSTNEKREALGYGKAPQAQDKTVLATELGVGGTQSLISIMQSETMTDAEKRASFKILFGLDDEQAYQLIPLV